MKLTADTISILKNFATISNSIVIEPGSKINTVSVDNSIMASAEVVEEFTRQFAIYDLPEFLSIMSLFKEPLIEFSSTKEAVIRSDNISVNYTFAEPSIIKKAPSGVKDLPAIAKFELKSKTLDNLIRAMSIMGLQYILIEGDGEKLFIAGVNINGTSKSNTYREEIGQTDKEFKTYLELTNIKIINADYNVEINDRLVKLSAIDRKLTYWVGIKNIRKG